MLTVQLLKHRAKRIEHCTCVSTDVAKQSSGLEEGERDDTEYHHNDCVEQAKSIGSSRGGKRRHCTITGEGR